MALVSDGTESSETQPTAGRAFAGQPVNQWIRWDRFPGNTKRVDRATRRVGEDGRLIFRYPKTQLPGDYNLTVSGAAQGPRSDKFLVSRDPDESNLTPLSPQQIGTLSEAGGLAFGSDPFYQPPGHQVIAQPRALAGWLLLGLVLVMVTEAAVAFWLARQRHIALPAVEMEPTFRV